MKKKNYMTRTAALIIATAFAVCQAQGQNSALSGTAAASNGAVPAAGNGGTNNTNVGSGAGAAVAAGALQNTNVGKTAGNAISTGDDNTCIGFESGKLTTTGSGNSFLGSAAGAANTTQVKNTMIGYQAGNANVADSNVAVGYQAMKANTTGAHNVSVGYQAMYAGTGSSASENTACGFQALKNSQAYGGSAFGFWAARDATTACGLSAFGEEALRDNTTGFYNTGMGVAALHFNQTGWYNVAVGHNAGAGVSANSHSYNSFFGAWAGQGISTGNDNTFAGYKCGYTNTTGASNSFVGDSCGLKNTTGSKNVFMGHLAGYNNTTASNGVYIGQHAGYSNTTGANNAFVGYSAGSGNTTGMENAALGNSALFTNTVGNYNTAVGNYAMRFANNCYRNSAFGYVTLYNNTGDYNTAMGYSAGNANTSGYHNTCIGAGAGQLRSNDTSCVFLGYGADATGNLQNSAAIGNGASVNASNKIRFGNAAVTVIEGTVAYTVSDKRFKENITEEVKGLEFINLLRPVVYNFNAKKFEEFLTQNMPDSVKAQHMKADFGPATAIRQSGFIAQEVEKAAKEVNYNFNGVHVAANANDNYSLAYAEFVVPLVKSVQELSKKDAELQEENKKQGDEIAVLQKQIAALSAVKANGSSTLSAGTTAASQDVNLKDGQNVVLDQNVPNPFAEQTVIGYFLPDNTAKAQMLFYNAAGKLIQSVDLNEKGKGSLNVFASDLSNGSYTYTLVVDGKVVETKKMIKQQ
jgi:hypothetical protein